jgi:hypothetical protein
MNNQCDELKKPIVHLVDIKVDEPASLISYRANFYYSVNNETKIHEYHYENKNLQYINSNLDINLDAITNYDDTTKEVTTNLIGTNGFYIPTRSSGYFEIEIQIGQNNNLHSYCFHKPFSFSGETYYDRNINIKEIFIDYINNDFKRIVF